MQFVLRWWLPVCVGALLFGGGVYYWHLSRISIPDSLAQKRAEVVKLLDASAAIDDPDVGRLLVLEQEAKYAEAVALMDAARAANDERETLIAHVGTLARELSDLALLVKPDAVGTKAVEAFGILQQLAESQARYFANRRAVYEQTRAYYAALAIAPKAAFPIPLNLEAMVREANAELERARALNMQFTEAIQAFDAAVQAQQAGIFRAVNKNNL